MTAKDFGQLLKDHPEMLDDGKKFAAILRDIYPREKGNVNQMIIAYNAGVVSMLRKSDLDSLLTARIMSLLMDDYGIAEERARWAAELWLDAYSFFATGTILAKSTSHTTVTNTPPKGGVKKTTPSVALTQKSIVKPAKTAMRSSQLPAPTQETNSDCFEVKQTYKGCIIEKYIDQGVEQIVIPATIKGKCVTVIGSRAFQGCHNLTSVTIPEGVKRIWREAFNGCANLTNVTIPESVIDIDSRAFLGCPQLTIYAPNGSYAESFARDAVIHSNSLPAVQFSETKPTIQSSETNTEYFEICSYSYSCIIKEYIGPKTGSIAVPAKINGKYVTEIGSHAFYGRVGLNIIHIPEGVTKIGAEAFWGCIGLTNVFIPKSVTEIGIGVFSRCKKLTICAPAGSYSEEYAKQNRIRFKSYDNSL